LYSRDVPLEQKRVIARKLIEVTLDAFRLRPDDRHRITIQFLPQRRRWIEATVDPEQFQPSPDLTVEVRDHNLTEDKRKAFAAAAARVLNESVAKKFRHRIVRFLGGRADDARQVAFQFKELEPLAGPPPKDSIIAEFSENLAA
jgi:hypothetical protein